MKVLVDATGASKGGMQTYIRGLFGAWADLFPNDDLHVLVTDEVKDDFDPLLEGIGKVIRVGSGQQHNRIRVQQFSVPRMSRAMKPEVVFCMVPVAPRFLANAPLVCVAHDFRHLHRPEEFSRPQRFYRQLVYSMSLRKADVVIANSQATAEEVRTIVRDSEKPVRVVYMGASLPDKNVPPTKASPHALAFGHWTNKQPDVSIKTWAHLKDRQPDLNVVLHIVGVPVEQRDELEALARQLGVADLISIDGFVPDDRYWPLFRSARLILMPSTFEGFGMPLIEALANGIPVVASQGVGLEEAGKQFALYAAPDEPADFAEHCHKILAGEYPDERRIEAIGYASEFTWARCAAETRETLVVAVQQHGRRRTSWHRNGAK